jgi:hypothetical protein
MIGSAAVSDQPEDQLDAAESGSTAKAAGGPTGEEE